MVTPSRLGLVSVVCINVFVNAIWLVGLAGAKFSFPNTKVGIVPVRSFVI